MQERAADIIFEGLFVYTIEVFVGCAYFSDLSPYFSSCAWSFRRVCRLVFHSKRIKHSWHCMTDRIFVMKFLGVFLQPLLS